MITLGIPFADKNGFRNILCKKQENMIIFWNKHSCRNIE